MIGVELVADHPQFGRHVAHGCQQFHVALVAHQPRHDDDGHPVRRHAEFGANSCPRVGVGPKQVRAAPVAGRLGAAVQEKPSRVRGLLDRNSQISVGEAGADKLHREPAAAAQQASRLVVEVAVRRVGHAGHARHARGDARQEAADRHVRMHQVGPFRSKNFYQGPERPPLRAHRDGAGERQRDDAETFRPGDLQQRTVGRHADHLVPARP